MVKQIVKLPDGVETKRVEYKGSFVTLRNGDIYDNDANMVKIFNKYFEEYLDLGDSQVESNDSINTIEKDVVIEID
jgi:hypothetical protein